MAPGVMRTTAFCVGVAPRIAGRNNQVVLLEEVRFGSEEANSRRTGIGVMIMRVLCKQATMAVTSSCIKIQAVLVILGIMGWRNEGMVNGLNIVI